MNDRLTKLLFHNKLLIINKNYFKNNNKNKLYEEFKNNIIIKYSDAYVKAKNNRDLEFFSERVKIFLATLYLECPNFNSKIFSRNFLTTVFDIEDMFSEKGCGRFTANNINKLYIGDVGAIYHELLHMAQFGGTKKIAAEIYNEGYTELLNKRYFYSCDNIEAYVYPMFFMGMIERVYGKDKLEKLYFTGQFQYKIIDLLKIYLSDEDIFKLTSNLNNLYKIENIGIDNDKAQLKFNNILEIINKLIINKLDCDYGDDYEKKIEFIEKNNLIISGWFSMKSKLNPEVEYKILYDNKEALLNLVKEKNKGISL